MKNKNKIKKDNNKKIDNKIFLSMIEETLYVIESAEKINKIINDKIAYNKFEEYMKNNSSTEEIENARKTNNLINYFYIKTYNFPGAIYFEYKKIFDFYIKIYEKIFRSSCVNLNDSTFAYNKLAILEEINKEYLEIKSKYKKSLQFEKNFEINYEIIVDTIDQIETIENYMKKNKTILENFLDKSK